MDTFSESLTKSIIAKTLRVPAAAKIKKGDGSNKARQLDVVLMSCGFKASGELLAYLSTLHPAVLGDLAVDILDSVRELVGEHVDHNSYFIDFPFNVPDTLEFWVSCIADALEHPETEELIQGQLDMGWVNLLDLPKYGKYLHTYEEMLDAHEAFITSPRNRQTVLHLGKSLPEEALKLYKTLAGARVPLNEDDRELLARLAELCVSDPQPKDIPMRENRAIINGVRLENDKPLIIDTVTDVLRLASVMSGGDVTLDTPTKFKSFPRSQRRILLKAINKLLTDSTRKINDVALYREQWKRLGERLHPGEYTYSYTNKLFMMARQDVPVRSLASGVEECFRNNQVSEAIIRLGTSPGMLVRSVDRILRIGKAKDMEILIQALGFALPKVSSKVVLSLREHLQNRTKVQAARIFSNTKGTAYVTPDERGMLSRGIVNQLVELLDNDIVRRLPVTKLVIDPSILDIAIPLSNKQTAEGFRIMPRGSVLPANYEILRFFCYWHESHNTTDFDLSAALLDENFELIDQVSYTNLRADGAVHSGDITSAPTGASEFIDIELANVDAKYLVPQVNIYSGESFLEVKESFFGFMQRTYAEKGKPFEAATVWAKSEMRDKGKVSLPLVFAKGKNGEWTAKWMHLYLKGQPRYNRVEGNHLSTSLLAKAIVQRKYLTVGDIVELMKSKAEWFETYRDDMWKVDSPPVTYIGVDAPANLPKGSTAITLSNLADIIPA